MLYDSREEVQRRLAGSTVIWDGEPVNVADVAARNRDGTFPLIAYNYNNSKEVPGVVYGDPRLEYKVFDLGYANMNREAIYVTRTPARIIRQGLEDQNVMCSPSEIPGAGLNNRMRFRDLRVTKGFRDMIVGDYPSFEAAAKKLRDNHGDVISVAFHRQFAIKYDPLGLYKLVYRGKEIAWGDSKFKLGPNFQYLKEMCAQQGVPCDNEQG